MKHYVLPLTSEFYGISMAALKKMLASNQNYFSAERQGASCNFR